MSKEQQVENSRDVRSFLMARDPSIDRRDRPRPERQVRLFGNIKEEESEDDSISTASCDENVNLENILSDSKDGDGALIYLRLRPVDAASLSYNICTSGNVFIVKPAYESQSISNNKNTMEKHFSFSDIFESCVKQSDIYNKCVVQKISAEENFTLLLYGTSGSGKTFTALGDENNPGIIPRSLENIFTMYSANIYPQPMLKLINGNVSLLNDDNCVKEKRFTRDLLKAYGSAPHKYKNMLDIIQSEQSFQTKQLDDVSVFIWVSFAEIYNEFVYDLLMLPQSGNQFPKAETTSRKNLKIIRNNDKAFIKGLTAVNVQTSLEALMLLHYGLQHVTYASTAINANSSRSHCIFIVDILRYHASGTITEISYKYCDLAGSERLDKTGNTGCRLKEAQRINTSLMVLGRCLNAVTSSRKKADEVIPVRDSKLTMLIQSALHGTEKLSMIVNLTPSDKFYEENINVLNFSSIAKNLIFKEPEKRQTNSRFSLLNTAPDNYRDQLLKENLSLRTELEDLQSRQVLEWSIQEQAIRREMVDNFQKIIDQKNKDFEERLQNELAGQQRLFELKIGSLKRRHKEEIEDLRAEYESESDSSINNSLNESKKSRLDDK